MHPELKAYLDEYQARTMARYDAMDRKFALQDALISKLLGGASTPHPARPMVTATDGSFTDGTTDPVVALDAFSTVTQAQEVPMDAHDAPPVCIELVPITCSTDCSNQAIAIPSLASPMTTTSLLPAVTQALVTNLAHSGTYTIDLMQPFRNHGMNISPPTRHQGLVDQIAEGNEIQSALWPSFPISVPLEDNDDSCFTKQLLPEGKQWLLELCACPISTVLELQHSYLCTTAAHLFLSMKKIGALSTEQSSYAFLQFMQVGPYALVLHELQDSDSSLFVSGLVQPILSARTIILAAELHNSCLGTASMHLFRSVKKCGAGNTDLASSRGLKLIQFEPHEGLLPQVTCVMKNLFGDLNSPRTCSRYLPKVQLVKQCFPEKVVCWMPMVPRDIPVLSQPTMRFMDDLNLGATKWQLVLFYVQPSYEFRAQDEQPGFGFSQKYIQLKPGPSFSYDCRTVQVCPEVLKAKVPVIHEHARELASCLCLQKLLRTRNLMWNYLSREEFKGSGPSNRGCRYEQYDDLWVLLACLAVQHIRGLQILCIARSLPPTIQILNEPQVSIASDFIQIVPSCCTSPLVHQLHNSIGLASAFMLLVSSDSEMGTSEYLVNCHASYAFYLERFALGLSLHHLQEANPSCTILVLNWLGSSARYKPCSCSLDNKYVVVVQFLALPVRDLIGNILKRGMQPNAMEGKEYTSISYLRFRIHLVELEQCIVQIYYGIKTGLPPLCVSTSKALLALWFEWPLSFKREFIAGAMAISIQQLCSAGVTSIFSMGVERSSPLCDILHSSKDQDAGNSTDKRVIQQGAPYDVWPTRCMQLVIDGPLECLQLFQLKPPWHQYIRDCIVRGLMIVARISSSSVQFNSMEAKAWTWAEVLNCKNYELDILCYNKVDAKLCTTSGDLLLLPNQKWHFLCRDPLCDLTNASTVHWVEYPTDNMHQSLNPGSITITISDFQPSEILMVPVISKRASAMSGITSFTYYNQDPFQEGRGVIAATAVFTQGFVGRGYYLGFDCDGVEHGYIFDASLDWISVHHNHCFYLVEVYANFDYHCESNHVQEHRMHWDPGGCQWCRLGVKPSFKKGGMLGVYCNLHMYVGCFLRSAYGPAQLCVTLSAAGYKYWEEGNEETIRAWIRQRQRRPPLSLIFLYLLYLLFFIPNLLYLILISLYWRDSRVEPNSISSSHLHLHAPTRRNSRRRRRRRSTGRKTGSPGTARCGRATSPANTAPSKTRCSKSWSNALYIRSHPAVRGTSLHRADLRHKGGRPRRRSPVAAARPWPGRRQGQRRSQSQLPLQPHQRKLPDPQPRGSIYTADRPITRDCDPRPENDRVPAQSEEQDRPRRRRAAGLSDIQLPPDLPRHIRDPLRHPLQTVHDRARLRTAGPVGRGHHRRRPGRPRGVARGSSGAHCGPGHHREGRRGAAARLASREDADQPFDRCGRALEAHRVGGPQRGEAGDVGGGLLSDQWQRRRRR